MANSHQSPRNDSASLPKWKQMICAGSGGAGSSQALEWISQTQLIVTHEELKCRKLEHLSQGHSTLLPYQEISPLLSQDRPLRHIPHLSENRWPDRKQVFMPIIY